MYQEREKQNMLMPETPRMQQGVSFKTSIVNQTETKEKGPPSVIFFSIYILYEF